MNAVQFAFAILMLVAGGPAYLFVHGFYNTKISKIALATVSVTGYLLCVKPLIQQEMGVGQLAAGIITVGIILLSNTFSAVIFNTLIKKLNT